MPKGRVFKSTGLWYIVQTPNGDFIKCRIKGNIRLNKSRNTNPIAVGDWVRYEVEKKTTNGIIQEIYPRQNYIIRRSTNLSKREHIIASNIDMAALIISFKNPKTLTGFIDRFLVTAEAYSIPTTLVINKIDLYDSELMHEVNRIKNIYEKIGYTVLLVSTYTTVGIERLKETIKGKTTLFSGHSGVGKSSLLNTLVPGLNLKVGIISEHHEKGTHTTTFAEMYLTEENTYLIDTPGIKSFAIIDFKREEIARFFPEIFKASAHCKYYNCLHINEPNCFVKELVKSGEISSDRYHNYLTIYESDNFKEEWE
jgi:ribosome biogenesis GTPase